MAELVLKEKRANSVVLTLNRPESANALSVALLTALIKELNELQFDTDTRTVILTGAGEKVFCAGADLKERKGMSDREVRQTVHLIRQSMNTVARLPMPVIAAVNGMAFGGGTELALAADIRIAGRNAKMGLTETSLAIIPGAGGTQRLPRLIGLAKAKELIFTARRIDAETALALGLVNQVVEPGAVLDAAFELATEISANGPLAVRQAKLAMNQGNEVDLATGLTIEEQAYEIIIPTNDRLEGLKAFAEKRKPVYRGD
ncbi:enoyl-CoA hydratase [Alicyclobacillus sp. SO9]|uniref:enoyl-CoA hydratase n=1 Tax=Alicyclobacillus sp. SO9 TaxID=2665646 RepID=UPI0018E7ADDC|nr:enoyl-CoA hydratase [Alicyclobacillus sp. SO9]QQE80696.1 enoyl-CoA hydratase [Alicyclobacillus sp. SO9]